MNHDRFGIFNDLHNIQQLKNQLNGGERNILPAVSRQKIHFTDDHFRQFSGFQMSSTQIKYLLLETSRVEFKLTFPVRLKSTGSRENSHRMNYYRSFFEKGAEKDKIFQDTLRQASSPAYSGPG